MRRFVFLTLGVLEVLVALALIVCAWQLPGSGEVKERVARIEKISRNTEEEVARMRRRVALLRARRPQLDALSDQVHAQMARVNSHLESQQIDYDTVQTVSTSLGNVARGLDGLATIFNPETVGQFGKGLGETADYLDEKVAPTAEKAAKQLEETTGELRGNALLLSKLLEQAPPDLKAAKEVHDGLARFDEGLVRLERMVKVQKLQAMREGFKGLETSLKTGAGQVDKLAGYTYPVVRFEGLRPVVEQKDFWPEGKTIAEGMRKAAKGVTVAGEELDNLGKEMPEFQESLAESRKVVQATREALARALSQREEVEALLKEVPQQLARLARELPDLSANLAQMLRDTGRLKEVAQALRETQKGVDQAVARWPQLRKDLSQASTLLRTTQQQLDQALEQRDAYTSSFQKMVDLLRAFVDALPFLTEALDQELHHQEVSLAQLEGSLGEINSALPVWGNNAAHLLQTTRLLLVLVSLVFAVHGGYLLVGWRLGPSFSG
jgi:uncharacterized phage infection (PIP) family protein YhgE